MNEAPVELGPGRFRAIQRAACATARGLAREHGQHQFYTLSQVQSQAAAVAVDASLLAWVYAVFVTRDDFEAYFAVREAPGTYWQLRVAMTPETRSVPDPTSGAVSDDAWADCRDELDELAQWLARSTDLI